VATLSTRQDETEVIVERQGEAVTALQDHVASVDGRQDDAEARQDETALVLSHHHRRLNHMGAEVLAMGQSLTAVVAVQEASMVAIAQHQRMTTSHAAVLASHDVRWTRSSRSVARLRV
jgi:hypothetical protein